MALLPGIAGGTLGKPTLRDLSNLAPEVDHKWYGLGVQLLEQKDVKVLSTIETDHRGDVETCCTKMFERWLDIVPTANWSQLITGLKAPNVKLHKLADELTKQLGGQAELNEAHPSELSLCSQPYRQGSQPGSPYHSTPLGSPDLSQVPQLMEPASPDDYGVEFSLLVSKISEIIQNSSATNLASIKHALALVTVHKMSSRPLFSDAELKQIKQSKNICEIIEQCRTRWSWSNYSLLKLIVKKSGSEEAKRELKKFQKVVNVRQKVKSLGKNWLQDPKNYSEGYESMMVVLDEFYDDVTVHHLEEVEKIISKTTLLPSQALEMTEVTETNSVLIKWRIPIEAVPYVVMLAFQNKEEFLRQSFLLLRIAGMDVFNLCKAPHYQSMFNLRRMNSTLSEDCERYIGEVSELSMERDKLNEKVTQYEEKMKKLQLKCQEKDDEIKLHVSEINRLGNQVKYLNKKVNTLQDHMRGKKPSLATTEAKQKAQQPHHTMQPPHHTMQQSQYTMQQSQYTMQQSQYTMQQSRYTMQQSQYMMQQSSHTMQQPQQQPSDETMGISGGSLGTHHPPVSEAPSDMGLTRYGASGIGAFVPETIPSPPPQSTTDLHTAAPTTVRDQITAMNKHTEEQRTVYSSTKQIVSHQKYTRTKTPVFELVLNTKQRDDELQKVFNRRRSSKELETSSDFEEYVQQKVSKQQTKIEELQQTYIPEQATAAVYRKQQQQRYYMHYEDSRY